MDIFSRFVFQIKNYKNQKFRSELLRTVLDLAHSWFLLGQHSQLLLLRFEKIKREKKNLSNKV